MTTKKSKMSRNHIQEQLSLSYIRTVVFGLGFNLSNLVVDDHGIDGTIKSYAKGINRVDFQLKATTDYDIRNEHIIYDLRVENYNQLTDDTGIPQALILFVMSTNDRF